MVLIARRHDIQHNKLFETLSITISSVIMMCIALFIVMLSVIMLSVFMLSVVAPKFIN
jgi:hypothetical protein